MQGSVALNQQKIPGSPSQTAGLILQFSPNCQQHHRVAGHAAHQIGDRLGPEDAVHPQEMGQDPDQGDHQAHLPEQGEEDGVFRLAQRGKGGLTAHLGRHEAEAKEKDMQQMGAKLHQRRIIVEQPHQCLRDQEHHAPGQQHIAGADGGHEDDALLLRI